MDPQATWEQLLCAYSEGDWDRIEELATALLSDIRKQKNCLLEKPAVPHEPLLAVNSVVERVMTPPLGPDSQNFSPSTHSLSEL